MAEQKNTKVTVGSQARTFGGSADSAVKELRPQVGDSDKIRVAIDRISDLDARLAAINSGGPFISDNVDFSAGIKGVKSKAEVTDPEAGVMSNESGEESDVVSGQDGVVSDGMDPVETKPEVSVLMMDEGETVEDPEAEVTDLEIGVMPDESGEEIDVLSGEDGDVSDRTDPVETVSETADLSGQESDVVSGEEAGVLSGEESGEIVAGSGVEEEDETPVLVMDEGETEADQEAEITDLEIGVMPDESGEEIDVLSGEDGDVSDRTDPVETVSETADLSGEKSDVLSGEESGEPVAGSVVEEENETPVPVMDEGETEADQEAEITDPEAGVIPDESGQESDIMSGEGGVVSDRTDPVETVSETVDMSGQEIGEESGETVAGSGVEEEDEAPVLVMDEGETSAEQEAETTDPETGVMPDKSGQETDIMSGKDGDVSDGTDPVEKVSETADLSGQESDVMSGQESGETDIGSGVEEEDETPVLVMDEGETSAEQEAETTDPETGVIPDESGQESDIMSGEDGDVSDRMDPVETEPEVSVMMMDEGETGVESEAEVTYPEAGVIPNESGKTVAPDLSDSFWADKLASATVSGTNANIPDSIEPDETVSETADLSWQESGKESGEPVTDSGMEEDKTPVPVMDESKVSAGPDTEVTDLDINAMPDESGEDLPASDDLSIFDDMVKNDNSEPVSIENAESGINTEIPEKVTSDQSGESIFAPLFSPLPTDEEPFDDSDLSDDENDMSGEEFGEFEENYNNNAADESNVKPAMVSENRNYIPDSPDKTPFDDFEEETDKTSTVLSGQQPVADYEVEEEDEPSVPVMDEGETEVDSEAEVTDPETGLLPDEFWEESEETTDRDPHSGLPQLTMGDDGGDDVFHVPGGTEYESEDTSIDENEENGDDELNSEPPRSIMNDDDEKSEIALKKEDMADTNNRNLPEADMQNSSATGNNSGGDSDVTAIFGDDVSDETKVTWENESTENTGDELVFDEGDNPDVSSDVSPAISPDIVPDDVSEIHEFKSDEIKKKPKKKKSMARIILMLAACLLILAGISGFAVMQGMIPGVTLPQFAQSGTNVQPTEQITSPTAAPEEETDLVPVPVEITEAIPVPVENETAVNPPIDTSVPEENSSDTVSDNSSAPSTEPEAMVSEISPDEAVDDSAEIASGTSSNEPDDSLPNSTSEASSEVVSTEPTDISTDNSAEETGTISLSDLAQITESEKDDTISLSDLTRITESEETDGIKDSSENIPDETVVEKDPDIADVDTVDSAAVSETVEQSDVEPENVIESVETDNELVDPLDLLAAQIEAGNTDEETAENVDNSTGSLFVEEFRIIEVEKDIENIGVQLTGLKEEISQLNGLIVSSMERSAVISSRVESNENSLRGVTAILTEFAKFQDSLDQTQIVLLAIGARVDQLEESRTDDRNAVDNTIQEINNQMKRLTANMAVLARATLSGVIPGDNGTGSNTGSQASSKPDAGTGMVYTDRQSSAAVSTAVPAAAPVYDIPLDVAKDDFIEGYGYVLDILPAENDKKLVILEHGSVLIPAIEQSVVETEEVSEEEKQ